MTKREKILNYLTENGIDPWFLNSCEVKDKWQKPGTVVLSFLPKEMWRKLYFDLFRDCKDRKIDIHQIRVNFQRQDDCYRISWIGE